MENRRENKRRTDRRRVTELREEALSVNKFSTTSKAAEISWKGAMGQPNLSQSKKC